jgi:two-component system, response regulator
MAELQNAEILLVEDNPNDVELTQRALRKQKLDDRVFVVNDGAQALDYLFGTGSFAGRSTDYRPRVIFLDLKLPKVNGVEVLRKIRSDSRTRTIPVVVLTSSHEERDLIESYDLGVNSYIVKPVEFDKFFQTVGEIGTYWLVLNKTPL